MPIDRSRYPDDWDDVAFAIKEKAGWLCEDCGIGHMADRTMGSCLTVHHPNCDPENPDAEKTALCARCHLKAERNLRHEEKHKNQMRLF